MPAWPSTLPATPLMDKFRETSPDTLIRTEMETGPAKIRRRSTAGVRGMTLGYLLSRAQVAALESFYLADTAGGALAFDFTHPRSGAALVCRFRSPPAYESVNGEYFHVAVALEALP